MIPLAEINKVAEKFQVPADTIEKDYVICWILTSLSASKLKKDFIFYGGTAIKRMHFEEHRFSEDIDLISESELSQDFLISEITQHLSLAKVQANLVMNINDKKTLSAGTRTQIFIEYSGYNEIIGAPKEVRLNFAMGMHLYGDTEKRKLFKSYSDLKNISFPVMTLNTIFAGKLGLLMSSTRKEPRDLFDVWFLLNRLDQFDFDLNLMRQAFKQKYSFYPSLSVLNVHLNNRLYKERWEIRLAKQIADLPKIDPIIKEIQTRLADLFDEKELL